jgi:hypothetical protein
MIRLLALGFLTAYGCFIWHALTHPTAINQLFSVLDPGISLYSQYDPENPATFERLACERMLRNSNPPVRKNAAGRLGALGHDARPAVPALMDALNDSEWGVVDAAAQALLEIDPIAAKNAGLSR